MVETAVADVVSPAVPAHAPDTLPDQGVADFKQSLGFPAVDAFQLILQCGYALALLVDFQLIHLSAIPDRIDKFTADLIAQGIH